MRTPRAPGSSHDPIYNGRMGTFTRKRQRLLGLWILTAILMKMVAPAFSHVLVPGAGINDRWIVAVCTATGLKYIDISPASEAQDADQGQTAPTTDTHRSADHCLLCSTHHHDGLINANPSAAVTRLDERHSPPDRAASKPARTDQWPGAHPRAPPFA